MISITAIVVMKNGKDAFVYSSTDAPRTEQPAYIDAPTGGV